MAAVTKSERGLLKLRKYIPSEVLISANKKRVKDNQRTAKSVISRFPKKMWTALIISGLPFCSHKLSHKIYISVYIGDNIAGSSLHCLCPNFRGLFLDDFCSFILGACVPLFFVLSISANSVTATDRHCLFILPNYPLSRLKPAP